MNEYVEVPAELLKKTATMAKYFEQSYTYADALKPRPTIHKKKTNANARK